MADDDEIFVRSVEPLGVFAERVAGVLGLEFMRDLRSGTGETSYRMRARTFDDWIGVYVGPNYFDPEPGQPQAMDVTGTHYFGDDVTVDDPDVGVWRSWVVGSVGSNVCASGLGPSTNSLEVAS